MLWIPAYAGMTVRDAGNDGRFCKGPTRFRTHNRKLEATGGIEPPNKGFANPRLNHLATSPASFEYIPLKPSHKPSATASDYTDTNTIRSTQLVPGVGLEPTRPFEHCALNAACLPFQHPGIMSSLYKNLHNHKPKWSPVNTASPTKTAKTHLAGAAGFEPATFGFGDQRSSQLSYAPVFMKNYIPKTI